MIYFDHAATTYLDPEVEKAMKPYWQKQYGNPSSIHQLGRQANSALLKARQKVSDILNADLSEIIFTGSGTESDNLAVLSAGRYYKNFGRHIITSQIEHQAVLNPCAELEKEGFEITYLPVDKWGIVKLNDLEKALRPDTILVSIMYANNEVGAIQPISEIAKTISDFRKQSAKRKASARGRSSRRGQSVTINDSRLAIRPLPLFHTDACQAAGALSLNTKKLGVDLMTLSASKIYGPKGVGCLYVKQGIKLQPLIFGGHHEYGLRAGTENVAGIVGFAKALELVQKNSLTESKRLIKLRDRLIRGILEIPKTYLNGHPQKRLPNNLNASIYGIEGEALVLYLDKYGICASTGAACAAKSLTPSHVLMAMGIKPEMAHSNLRLTLGKRNTEKDIKYFLKVFPEIVKKLRQISTIK